MKEGRGRARISIFCSRAPFHVNRRLPIRPRLSKTLQTPRITISISHMNIQGHIQSLAGILWDGVSGEENDKDSPGRHCNETTYTGTQPFVRHIELKYNECSLSVLHMKYCYNDLCFCFSACFLIRPIWISQDTYIAKCLVYWIFTSSWEMKFSPSQKTKAFYKEKHCLLLFLELF